MTLVVEILLGLVALLNVGWTVLSFKVARRSLGDDATVVYRQSVAFAVIAVAFAGLAYSIHSDNGLFGIGMCVLLAAAFIFKRINIRRLTLATGKSD